MSYPFYTNVCELAANSDALIICCGLTEQTWHMINREVLLALGEGVIVNIGRGAIIDEKNWCSVWCKLGEIGGAGLDVFEDERLMFLKSSLNWITLCWHRTWLSLRKNLS